MTAEKQQSVACADSAAMTNHASQQLKNTAEQQLAALNGVMNVHVACA
jgi:hypothetical protein